MKQITNIFLKAQGEHFDLVLVSGKDTIVLACYDDRPLLLQRFRFDNLMNSGEAIPGVVDDIEELWETEIE